MSAQQKPWMKRTAEPTPGPWFVDHAFGEHGEDCGYYVQQELDNGEFRGHVCHLTDAEHIGGITKAERDANLRLIGASHRMLSALEEALEFVEDHVDVVDGSDGRPQPNRAMSLAPTLRAAIAAARGQA